MISVRMAKRTLKEFAGGSDRGFEHLTEGEDMVVSQDGHAFLCFATEQLLSFVLINLAVD